MRRPGLLPILIVAVLIVLWRTGTFDTQLAGSGLNAKPCGTNALGETICGRQYEILHAVQQGQERRQEHEAKTEAANDDYVHQAGTEGEARTGAGATPADKREARRLAEAEAEKELEEQEAHKANAEE